MFLKGKSICLISTTKYVSVKGKKKCYWGQKVLFISTITKCNLSSTFEGFQSLNGDWTGASNIKGKKQQFFLETLKCDEAAWRMKESLNVAQMFYLRDALHWNPFFTSVNVFHRLSPRLCSIASVVKIIQIHQVIESSVNNQN